MLHSADAISLLSEVFEQLKLVHSNGSLDFSSFTHYLDLTVGLLRSDRIFHTHAVVLCFLAL